jgi:hypothetical protein
MGRSGAHLWNAALGRLPDKEHPVLYIYCHSNKKALLCLIDGKDEISITKFSEEVVHGKPRRI